MVLGCGNKSQSVLPRFTVEGGEFALLTPPIKFFAAPIYPDLFSNSIIEAWWRSLKHQWLFLHPLDSVTTVCRLVEFYVDQHNRVLPHSAFHGQTPDEMYFGTGEAVPADLR